MKPRYKVAIGYPAPGMPSGMSSLRLRAHLTQEKFRAWCLLMQSLADMDKADQTRARERAQMTLPPGTMPPALTDVMVMMCVTDSQPPWSRVIGTLSAKSINDMIEFMTHWNSVENELEKESASTK